MRTEVPNKIFTVEEYIEHEISAPRKSEFINGQLFEMPGEKGINNKIALRIAFLLMQFLERNGFEIFALDVKVRVFGESKYYYPDVFVTKEAITKANEYIKSEPVLIVEVVSESSQVHDYVDKYIDYTKIPSLQYYLIVEPETTLLTCYAKSVNGEWQTVKYTKLEDQVTLEALQVTFQLKQVYPA